MKPIAVHNSNDKKYIINKYNLTELEYQNYIELFIYFKTLFKKSKYKSHFDFYGNLSIDFTIELKPDYVINRYILTYGDLFRLSLSDKKIYIFPYKWIQSGSKERNFYSNKNTKESIKSLSDIDILGWLKTNFIPVLDEIIKQIHFIYENMKSHIDNYNKELDKLMEELHKYETIFSEKIDILNDIGE